MGELNRTQAAGSTGFPANGLILERNDWIVNNAYLYGTMFEELLEMAGIATALARVISLFQHDPASGSLRLDPAVRRAVPSA